MKSVLDISILTLFPEMLEAGLSSGVLGRARSRGLVNLKFCQIRDFAQNKHRSVDDLPYGGGPGMVMRCEPLYEAWQSAKSGSKLPSVTLLFSPSGLRLNQPKIEHWAQALPGQKHVILVCGRYEGVDERFVEECVDLEVSLGDFVLSGGELAAMAWIDAVGRLIPGVLGNEESVETESFSSNSNGLLEFPQYTRPPEFRGRCVPEVLLSGDHKKIAQWRKVQSLDRTRVRRPELVEGDGLK